MKKLDAKEYKIFEDIKRMREDGSEYWKARELADALKYSKWDNFQKVINRAMIACENSGYLVEDQFPEVGKLIIGAKGAKRVIPDYDLTRYACYLIVQKEKAKKGKLMLDE